MKAISSCKPFFLAALAGGILLWIVPGRADALTADQAVAIARTFCQRVGAPVTVVPRVYPPSSGGLKMPTNWQAQWEVEFPDQADLDIADASGVVVNFINFGLSRDPIMKQPMGAAIPEADAVARATEVMQATGQPTAEMAFDAASLTSPPDWPGHIWKAGDHHWYVCWRRVFQGIPYHEQRVGVQMLPETGALIGLGIQFPTPPVTAVQTNVSPDAAAGAAVRHMAAVGATDYLLDQVTEEIVTPVRGMTGQAGHLLYFGPPAGQPLPQGQRAAWVCRFEGPEYNTAFVFVDAGMGGVIGGHIIGLRAARIPGKPSSLLAGLQKASEIDVYRRAGRYGWSKKPTVRLGQRSDLDLLRLLEISDGAIPGKTASATACRLVMAGTREFPLDVLYLPDQGLLGLPGEWYRVPTALGAKLRNAAGTAAHR